MDDLASQVAVLLDTMGIRYTQFEECIRIELPSGFGQMEIGGLPDGDSIVGLLNHEWHTHGSLLLPEYGEDVPAAIAAFIGAIFSGELKMVEFQLPGEKAKRIIEDDIESFLANKQPGEVDTVFKIENTEQGVSGYRRQSAPQPERGRWR